MRPTHHAKDSIMRCMHRRNPVFVLMRAGRVVWPSCVSRACGSARALLCSYCLLCQIVGGVSATAVADTTARRCKLRENITNVERQACSANRHEHQDISVKRKWHIQGRPLTGEGWYEHRWTRPGSAGRPAVSPAVSPAASHASARTSHPRQRHPATGRGGAAHSRRQGCCKCKCK